jgi:GntR family transcriptional regulator
MSTSLQRVSPVEGYVGIAGELRAQISRGTLVPNQQLPAISELGRRYRTTSVTVRRALRLLESEGLVRVEHGVGSFVADWTRAYDLLHLPSFAEEMALRDVRPGTAVVERKTGERCPPAALALGLDAGAPLAVLARMRKVEGRPVVFQRSYLPARLEHLVTGYDAAASLYELLRRETGQIPAAADERLTALRLPADVAGELEATGAPEGWSAVRTTYSASGEPLLYDEAFFAAGRVEIHVRRRASLTQMEYRIVPGAPVAPGLEE